MRLLSCNLGATKIELSCCDKNRLCKRAFTDFTEIIAVGDLNVLFFFIGGRVSNRGQTSLHFDLGQDSNRERLLIEM